MSVGVKFEKKGMLDGLCFQGREELFGVVLCGPKGQDNSAQGFNP